MVNMRNSSLDGVRAMAISLVVASHTGILLQGGFGNAMFFCLSGFLAAMPFKHDAEKSFLSIKQIINYYFGRAVRILPIYYVIIVTYYYLTRGFFSDRIDLLKNMLFIEGKVHLWFLQQQMVMYLCVPFIFLLMALVKRIIKTKYNDLVCGVVLIIFAILTRKYLTIEVFSLYGNGAQQVFRIWQFLIGFAVCYFYKAYNKSELDFTKHLSGKIICQGTILVFGVFAVLSAEPVFKKIAPAYEGYFIGWQNPMFCSVITGVLIFVLLIHSDGILSRILGCKAVAYIGEISFGIYIVHMFIIPYCNFGSSFRNFLGAYIVSICISAVLHVLVEKPSGIFAKTKSIKSLIRYYCDL